MAKLTMLTADNIMKEMYTKQAYKCPSCYTALSSTAKLSNHLIIGHNWSKPVVSNYIYSLNLKETNVPKAKEAHMPGTSTLTIATDKIGKAKKQRDSLRNRLRADVQRFASDYGCSTFEAMHAIVDTVMLDIDNNAKNYYPDTVGMPNQLAQTLLPQTNEIMGGAQGEAPTVAADPFAHNWTVPAKKKALPKKPMSQGLEKLDKDVTDADISAEIVWSHQGYGSGKIVKDLLAEFRALDDGNLYVSGYSSWLYGSNNFLPGQSGNFRVIIKIRKKSPYISAAMYKAFDPATPASGFKYRKLKNKQIYKLQDYSAPKPATTSASINTSKYVTGTTIPKPFTSIYAANTSAVNAISTSGNTGNVMVCKSLDDGLNTKSWYMNQTAKTYWQLPEGYMWINDTQKNQSFCMANPVYQTFPQEIAMHSAPPATHHWETYLGDTSRAVLMENHWGYGPDGLPKPSCKEAQFPYDPEDPEPWA